MSKKEQSFSKQILLVLGAILLTIAPFFSANTFTITNPQYFNEQNNIFETIHYLENEMLSLEFCAKDAKDINITVLCDSNKQITLPYFNNENKDSCYYLNKNFNTISCEEFDLIVSYNQDNKEQEEKRHFKKEKESKLLTHILNQNPDSLNDVELSQYLYVYSQIHGINTKEANDMYETLKNSRNNEKKCWPKSSCSIGDTLTIIKNLKDAGYSDESRLIADGIEYVNSEILLDKDISYTLSNSNPTVYSIDLEIEHEFSSGENFDCTLDIDDGDEVKTYSFSDSDNYQDLTISKNVEKNIEYVCDNTIDKIILRAYEEKISSQDDSNQDTLTYTLSTTDKNEYSNFNALFIVEDDFSSGSFSCDITIDGDDTTYNFDNTSTLEEMKIEKPFTDSVTIDCSRNIDTINLEIYGGDYFTQESKNSKTLTYEFSTNTQSEKFPIEIDIDYDFTNSELVCEVTPDSLSKKTYTFTTSNKNTEGLLSIKNIEISEQVTVSCDDEVNEILTKVQDKFQRVQIENSERNTQTATTTIPADFSKYSCVPDKENSNSCDFINSLLYLEINSKNAIENTNINKFVSSFLKKDDKTKRQRIENKNWIIDSGKYLELTDNSEVRSTLKFKQNNDGSWGSTPEVEETAHAVLGLQKKEPSSENVKDGKKWIYFNEPQSGWGNLEKNTLAYLAIKEQIKPYIQLNEINTIESGTKISITNPTIYLLKNIQLDFSKELKPYLSYKEDLGDLKKTSSLNTSIIVNPSFSGKATGYLTIKGVKDKTEIELLKIPVTLKAPVPITLDPVGTFVEGDIFTQFTYSTNNTGYSFVCGIQNPFENREEQITLTEASKTFQLSNIQQKEGKFTLSLECTDQEKNEFSLTQEVNVIKTIKTITTGKNKVTLSEPEEFSIPVTNTFDDKQTISISVEGDFKDIIIPAETSKILAKNETRDIYFTIEDKEIFSTLDENSTGNIILTATNYTAKIPIEIGTIQEEEPSSFPWVWTIIIALLLGFILLIIIRYKQMKELEMQEQQQEDEHNLLLEEEIEFEE
jgi:hypothetical protein